MEISSLNPDSSMPEAQNSSLNVVDIMATLRGENGCPWDREQTPESLKPYLLEEAYEVLEAIDTKDPSNLKEELGDLLLQILFHSQIASEEGHFTFHDVEKALADKLIRRHPHVFQKQDTQSPTTSGDVLRQWDQLKQQEKENQESPPSILSTVPKTAPALQRALQVQKRASRVSFDWKTIEPVLGKFKEELDELYAATQRLTKRSEDTRSESAMPKGHPDIEAEFGDVVFSLVNLSRFLRINPEEALRRATNKFIRRFQYVETQAMDQGKPVNEFPPETLDQWWETAKKQETPTSHQSETKNAPTT